MNDGSFRGDCFSGEPLPDIVILLNVPSQKAKPLTVHQTVGAISPEPLSYATLSPGFI
jgi:hypothetical protein